MTERMDWKKRVFSHIRDDLNNKVYVWGLILLTLAAYGFTFAHVSYGIDDFGVRHYLDLSPENHGNMLQQGRLIHILFYFVGGLVDVIPFLNNFLSAVLMTVSAVLFNGLFAAATDNRFNTFQKLTFLGFYISYPLLAFKFIYDLDVLVTALAYVCVALSLVFGFAFTETHKLRDGVAAAVLALLAIGSYESFNALYICAVLLVFILLCIFKNYEAKRVWGNGFILAGILVADLAVYYGVVKLLQTLTGNPAYSRYNIFSANGSVVDIVKRVLKKLFNPALLATVEFMVCIVLFIAVIVFFLIRKKRPLLLLLGFGFGVFLVIVNVIQASMLYRCCQAFNLFIAATALLVTACLDKQKVLRILSSAVAVIVLVLQLKDMNLWFYKDWTNYQKNAHAIDCIATDLYADYSVDSKPICFVNRDYSSFLMSWDESMMQTEIGESPIVSSIRFLGDITSDATFQLFEYQAYDKLIHPTVEQVQKAQEYSASMPAYPTDGYIVELDDIIVVNMGKVN